MCLYVSTSFFFNLFSLEEKNQMKKDDDEEEEHKIKNVFSSNVNHATYI